MCMWGGTNFARCIMYTGMDMVYVAITKQDNFPPREELKPSTIVLVTCLNFAAALSHD